MKDVGSGSPRNVPNANRIMWSAVGRSSDRPELIDINSASREQLLTLPGIDESRAEKIIETRPYKNKKELKKKKIVPEEVYKQISDKITATSPNK